MSAPKGNKFWQKRSKHGRDKIFESPEILWDSACEYFKYCQDNPFQEEDFIKSGPSAGKKVQLNRLRPFTIKGLCIFLHINEKYFNEFESRFEKKENPDQKEKDFAEIVTRIREVIFDQKFTGAAAGFFKENIIARDLGIKDNQSIEVKKEQPLFPDVEPQNFES